MKHMFCIIAWFHLLFILPCNPSFITWRGSNRSVPWNLVFRTRTYTRCRSPHPPRHRRSPVLTPTPAGVAGPLVSSALGKIQQSPATGHRRLGKKGKYTVESLVSWVLCLFILSALTMAINIFHFNKLKKKPIHSSVRQSNILSPKMAGKSFTLIGRICVEFFKDIQYILMNSYTKWD